MSFDLRSRVEGVLVDPFVFDCKENLWKIPILVVFYIEIQVSSFEKYQVWLVLIGIPSYLTAFLVAKLVLKNL